MRITIILFFLLISARLYAQNANDRYYDNYFNLKNYLTIDANPRHVIDYSCAIFVSPTAEQIEQMKAEYGEEDYYVGAEDSNFYAFLASKLLDSLDVKTVKLESGSIKLISKGKGASWTLDTSKKDGYGWNLILFNTSGTPMMTSAVDLTEADIKQYFF